MRAYSNGWRISETQDPQWRWRTPRKRCCGRAMAAAGFVEQEVAGGVLGEIEREEQR